MKNKFILLTVLCGAFVASCVNENEEEVFATTEQNIISDSVRITYDLNVKAILEQNCTFCHNATDLRGGVDLSLYVETLPYVNDNSIVDVLTASNGKTLMPLGGPALSQADINLITNWVSNGAPEN